MEPTLDIIFIDDDIGLLAIYVDVLRLEGISAKGFESAEVALAGLAAGLAAKMLFVDFLIPGIDGAALFESLRNLFKREPKPLLFAFSALNRQSRSLVDLIPLVDGFVTKPSDLDEFIQLAKDLLEGKSNSFFQASYRK